MPVYEYACNACESTFEEWQKITEDPHGTCEKCGSTDVRKLISQTSFVLKGSGWYKTDYGKSGKNGSAGASDAEKATKEEKSTEDKSTRDEKSPKDGKPAAESPAAPPPSSAPADKSTPSSGPAQQ